MNDSNTMCAQERLADVECFSVPELALTVGDLEALLLERFPAADAEDWDRTGLLVGDPADLVRGVACALDPTVEAVDAAARAGANVLLTHHPAFLDPPALYRPLAAGVPVAGSVVYQAVRQQVSLMCFHTALDVSHQAQQVLPGLFGLSFQRVLLPLAHDASKGYGQLCALPAEAGEAGEGGVTLEEFAGLVFSRVGRPPRVWGSRDTRLQVLATCTGSAGDVPAAALAAGADCLVCGEVKYHAALELAQQGLAIIELGHDVSENPLADCLLAELSSLSVEGNFFTIRLESDDVWWAPRTKRVY